MAEPNFGALGIQAVVWIKPNDVEYVVNHKAMYPAMFIDSEENCHAEPSHNCSSRCEKPVGSVVSAKSIGWYRNALLRVVVMICLCRQRQISCNRGSRVAR